MNSLKSTVNDNFFAILLTAIVLIAPTTFATGVIAQHEAQVAAANLENERSTGA